jgi:hypothetical protein
MGQVQGVGIEAAGIGRVLQVAGSMEQAGRLPGNQHDRPGGPRGITSSGVIANGPADAARLAPLPLNWETFYVRSGWFAGRAHPTGFAAAKPIPLLATVMTAIFPCSLGLSFFLFEDQFGVVVTSRPLSAT